MSDRAAESFGTLPDLLTTHTFGRSFVALSSVGSTNDVARQMARGNAPEGLVVAADEQTAGRGRLDRRWMAPSGTCLLFSILFRPDLALSMVSRLTMVCSLAVADAVNQTAGLSVAPKWPNDLIVPSGVRWRKLAGLLVESEMVGEMPKFVVVGIGLNVNVPSATLPELAPDATSILAETSREVDRSELLAAILLDVEGRYDRLQAGHDPWQEWAERLATLGQPVVATVSSGIITGVAEAVDRDGALLVRGTDGTLHTLRAGDVTLAENLERGQ